MRFPFGFFKLGNSIMLGIAGVPVSFFVTREMGKEWVGGENEQVSGDALKRNQLRGYHAKER